MAAKTDNQFKDVARYTASLNTASGQMEPEVENLSLVWKSKYPPHPVRILVITLVSIFVAEALVMAILHYLPVMDPGTEMFVDALILSLMIFPCLFLLVVRPMKSIIYEAWHANDELHIRNSELSTALKQVKMLEGLLPICMYCKKIRDDNNCWQTMESFISNRSEAKFSHSICTECLEEHYADDGE